MSATTIDITKWKLTDWKFWVVLFLIVVMAMLLFGAAGWARDQVLNVAKPAEESLAGALPD